MQTSSQTPEQSHLARVEHWVGPRKCPDAHIKAYSGTDSSQLLDTHSGKDTALDPTDLRR